MRDSARLLGRDPPPFLASTYLPWSWGTVTSTWSFEELPPLSVQVIVDTCEDGEHLPFIGLLAAALARAIQDFAATGRRRDAMVSLSAVTTL